MKPGSRLGTCRSTNVGAVTDGPPQLASTGAVIGAAPQIPDVMFLVRESLFPQWSRTVTRTCQVLLGASAGKLGVAEVADGKNPIAGGLAVSHAYLTSASNWLV